jgi:DNA-binding protein H-NS
MAKQAAKFEKMTLTELVQTRTQLERVLNVKIVAERQELQSKIVALSALEPRGNGGAHSNGRAHSRKRNGNGLSHRASSKPHTNGKVHPLKGRSAAPKYRGPNGETWAGRGLSPRWLTALEKKGKKRDQFLIEKH